MQCLFLVLLYKKFMKIFQRSCAKRFRFVSECKSTTGNHSDKIFQGKFLEKLIFEGIFGREGGEMRDGDDKRKKKGERGKEKDAPRHCRSEENEKERREMSEGDGGKDCEAGLRGKEERRAGRGLVGGLIYYI